MFKIRLIFATFLLSVFFLSTKAQETKYDEDVDKETYKYYMENNWDKLLKVGLEAKEKGINFYYLNLRIGFAYYYKKNYRNAIPFLKEAFNESPINQEYLYFAYLFAGRKNDATIFAKKIPEENKKEYNIRKEPVFGSIFIDGNILFNSEIEKLQDIDINGIENVYGEQSFITNHKYFSVGLENNIGKRIILKYSFGNVLMDKNQLIDSYNTKYNFEITNLQQQYYLNLNYHFAEGFDLSFALNFLDIKTSTKIHEDFSTYSDFTEHNTYDIFDTVYQADAILNVYDTIFNFNENRNQVFTDSTSEWKDMIFALSLWKDINLFKFGLHGNYSKINSNNFFQTGATVVYFPLGNLNLYLRTDFITKLDFLNRKQGQKSPGFYIKQLVGFKVFNNLWTECFYSYSQMHDFSSNDAFLVFNTGERVLQTGGVNFSYLMFKQKLKLNLSFIFMQKEYLYITHEYISDTEQTYTGIRHESYTYENNSTYWTEPQEFIMLTVGPTYQPVLNTDRYVNLIISAGLSFYF